MSIFSALKMILTLHCHESSHLLSDTMDRPLTRVERMALGLHLLICRNCRRFRQRLQILSEAVRRLATGAAATAPLTSAELSPEARSRIEDALRHG